MFEPDTTYQILVLRSKKNLPIVNIPVQLLPCYVLSSFVTKTVPIKITCQKIGQEKRLSITKIIINIFD